MSDCRCCNQPLTEVLLDLGHLALTGVFPRSVSEDVPTAPLRMLQCHRCGLVQLGHTVDPLVLYGQTYGYRSSLNRMMADHLRDVAFSASSAASLVSGDAVLDIGANDGTFLRSFEDGLCALTGIDPLALRWKRYYPEQAHVIDDFFPSHRLQGRYKLITALAMFYDFDDPMEALEEVARLLTPGGMFVCEVADFEMLARDGIYDGVCHEHLTYFTDRTLRRLLGRAGFTVESIRKTPTNGGSLLVFTRYTGRAESLAVHEDELLDAKTFQRRVDSQREELRHAIHAHRPVLGIGASTKGNVVLQYCNLTREDIPCIADVNPDKVGAYTPGTKIPVIAEDEADLLDLQAGIIFPWSLAEPIMERWHLSTMITPFPFVQVMIHSPAGAT